jgi:DNA-binding Xre family transcriptional regulator
MGGMITVAIREMAEKRGITTAYQLQRLTGAPPSMAAKWYRNEMKSIGIETLNLLCNALNCKPNDLLRFEPDSGWGSRKGSKR